jgi:hypothetical protein
MKNDTFKADFAKVLKSAGDKAEALVRHGAMLSLKKIIDKSPVGDPSMWADPDSAPKGYSGGRMKANWNTSIGNVNFSNTAPPDKTGAGALAKGAEVIATFKMGDIIYLTNSMPYAKRIEYDAWSNQAKAGVVRVTALEYQSIIKKQAAITK